MYLKNLLRNLLRKLPYFCLGPFFSLCMAQLSVPQDSGYTVPQQPSEESSQTWQRPPTNDKSEKNSLAKPSASAREQIGPNPRTVDASLPSSGDQKQALGFGVGQTILLGDFNKYGHNDMSLDLFYEYQASYLFSLLANIHQQTFKGDRGQKTEVGGFNVQIKGKYFDYDSFSPFWTAGLGLYYPQLTRQRGSALQETESKGVFGAVVGSGVSLELNQRFNFAFLGQLHLPFRIKQSNDSSFQGQYLKLMAALFIKF